MNIVENEIIKITLTVGGPGMKKLKSMFFYLILITFILPFTAHSKMYMWTDENGVKHVSNTAPPQNIKGIQQKGEKAFDEEKYQKGVKQREAAEDQKAKEEEQARIEKEKYEQKINENSSNRSKEDARVAGQLQSISSSKFVWEENSQQIASITKTKIGNWKIKRDDGFYIGIITKRGDLKPRDGGLLVNDVRMLVNIHESLIPYLSE